jgi:hypothetical protein
MSHGPAHQDCQRLDKLVKSSAHKDVSAQIA